MNHFRYFSHNLIRRCVSKPRWFSYRFNNIACAKRTPTHRGPASGIRLISLSILIFSIGLPLRAAKPNIILFVADDLGYASVNAYGASEEFVRTPHINKLAQEGIRFTNAYSTASVCTPTRYTMLTGQYSWRTRLKVGVVNNRDPLLIDPKRITIGKYLKQQGYRTAHVGKWHLGYKEKKFKNLLGTIKPGPIDVGFDYHFGVPNNFDDLHKVYIENDHIFGLRSDTIKAYGKSFYKKPYVGYDAPQRVCEEVMDFTTDKAIKWITGSSEKKPFFLYYCSVGVHHPILPSARMKGKSGVGLYGDFIQDVDYSVGRFMKTIQEMGLEKNTIFIFTSDNGGDLPRNEKAPERQAYDKGFHYNGPVRGDKHVIYEGGLKVPIIVRWPDQIKGGVESKALVTTADIFGTIVEALTGKLPDPNVAAPDSFSFYSILKDPAAPSKRPFLVHRDALGRQAIRRGKWKFIDNAFPDRKTSKIQIKGKKELYDLAKDPMEKHNVINDFPEVTSKLEGFLKEARKAESTRSLAQ